MVIDGSLISENAYFIKQREAGYADKSIAEIIREMMSQADSDLPLRPQEHLRARRPDRHEQPEALRAAQGLAAGLRGLHHLRRHVHPRRSRPWPSACGRWPTTTWPAAPPDLIEYFVERQLVKHGRPGRDPAGRAGRPRRRHAVPARTCRRAGTTAGALVGGHLHLASGVRSMERGTISMDRDAQGNDVFSDLELCRLAVPRRVYTMSHIDYVVDRLAWLYQHRDLVGGLEFIEEPPVLRFFTGKLEALDNWGAELAEAFKADFGPYC